MSKVYVISEKCDVLHDEYLSYEENIGVAESHLVAELKIEELKNKYLKEAIANGWMSSDFTSSYDGIPRIIMENKDALWKDKREYSWYIEEFELIDEL